jgi:phage regulator Rha-like protein
MKRFPEQFMFQLTEIEFQCLRSQFATSKRGGRRYLPYAFTEHGVLMLANILNSKTAISVSIQIIQTFVKLREFAYTHKDLAQKICQLERKHEHHDYQIQKIFDKIREVPEMTEKQVKVAGFKKLAERKIR